MQQAGFHCLLIYPEARLSDTDPIVLPLKKGPAQNTPLATSYGSPKRGPQVVSFHRTELAEILNVYGRRVAAGEWRDYAIDMQREKAVFSIFRRASEMPIYRVEKDPKLTRKQGAYSVISATGLILKRGHDLKTVLRAIDKRVRLASV